MRTKKFCDTRVRGYEETAEGFSDDDLEQHLFQHYPHLDEYQRASPEFRKWRRVVIVELLKRGLLDKDPGPNNEPEERR